MRERVQYNVVGRGLAAVLIAALRDQLGVDFLGRAGLLGADHAREQGGQADEGNLWCHLCCRGPRELARAKLSIPKPKRERVSATLSTTHREPVEWVPWPMFIFPGPPPHQPGTTRWPFSLSGYDRRLADDTLPLGSARKSGQPRRRNGPESPFSAVSPTGANGRGGIGRSGYHGPRWPSSNPDINPPHQNRHRRLASVPSIANSRNELIHDAGTNSRTSRHLEISARPGMAPAILANKQTGCGCLCSCGR